MADANKLALHEIYSCLLDYYGVPDWWPADDAFEVMVGAILTQNTAWPNVEKALAQLKQHNACTPEALAIMDVELLGELIRPSGYYNQKSRRLQGFAQWYLRQGGFAALAQRDTLSLRADLLALHGIGDETADDIVLYAFNKPSFVVDTYTRRLLSRLGRLQGKEKYADIQALFHAELDADVLLFNRYHALIVSHAKRHCLKTPLCSGCPLLDECEHGLQTH